MRMNWENVTADLSIRWLRSNCDVYGFIMQWLYYTDPDTGSAVPSFEQKDVLCSKLMRAASGENMSSGFKTRSGFPTRSNKYRRWLEV